MGGGITAFHVSYILGAISILLVSAVMLQSDLFSNVTAYTGILGNVVALGLYVPRIGLVRSVMMLWVWYVLVATPELPYPSIGARTR